MDKKYLLIYHAEDNDGVFSCAIIYNYLTIELHVKPKDIVFEGATYKAIADLYNSEDDIINLKEEYTNIIMTDISFNNVKIMQYLKKHFGHNFIWIDHHAPIIKESHQQGFDDIEGLRDTTRSAILNAYKYLYDPFDEKYNNKTLPEYFRILSGWDSFTYEQEGYSLDYVRNVNVGTNITFKLNITAIIEVVNKILNDNDYGEYIIDGLYDKGQSINEYEDEKNRQLIDNYGDYTWTVDGRPACALFLQGPSSSLIFESCLPHTKNGIVFKRDKYGYWVISLYNTKREYDKEFHCGEYLKKTYKGGGHAGAAGCTILEKQFVKILNAHKI